MFDAARSVDKIPIADRIYCKYLNYKHVSGHILKTLAKCLPEIELIFVTNPIHYKEKYKNYFDMLVCRTLVLR